MISIDVKFGIQVQHTLIHLQYKFYAYRIIIVDFRVRIPREQGLQCIYKDQIHCKPTTFAPQTELFLFHTLADNIMHFLAEGYQTNVNMKFHASMLSKNNITAGMMVCNSMIFDDDCRQTR